MSKQTIAVNKTDVGVLIEALQMAANRHESMSRVTTGRFMHRHDVTAQRMRELRERLATEALERVS
jgi:hypothetical protein